MRVAPAAEGSQATEPAAPIAESTPSDDFLRAPPVPGPPPPETAETPPPPQRQDSDTPSFAAKNVQFTPNAPAPPAKNSYFDVEYLDKQSGDNTDAPPNMQQPEKKGGILKPFRKLKHLKLKKNDNKNAPPPEAAEYQQQEVGN